MKKRNRNILLVSLALGILILIGLGIKHWVTVKLPEQIGISRVTITVHPDSIYLKIRVVVPDNDIVDWLLDSIRYSVSFDTVEFSSGIKEFGNEIADTIIDLPLVLYREILFSTIEKLQVKDSTHLIIKLEPYVNMPGKNNKLIPFTVTKRISVPIPPDVSLHDIAIEKIRINDLSMNAVLQVINLNRFEFIILNGTIYIDFPGLFDGVIVMAEPVHLKKEDTTFVEASVELGEVKYVRTAWNFIFKKDEMDYKYEGKLNITLVDEPDDTIEVVIRSN